MSSTPAPDVLAGLVITAEHLDDLERMRIRFGNQVAAFERDYGWTPPHLDTQLKALRAQEHEVELALKRLWRRHPLAPWAKSYLGLGEKSIARLIGIIGDPAERPNVAKLWQFCGHGDPRMSRPPKGATQAEVLRCGSPKAKKTVWLIATSMLKAGNREWYDAARAKYEERDWTDGHKNAAALRYVGKQFLRDLWVAARASEARDGNQTTDDGAGQKALESQRSLARASHPTHDAQQKNGGAGE